MNFFEDINNEKKYYTLLDHFLIEVDSCIIII